MGQGAFEASLLHLFLFISLNCQRNEPKKTTKGVRTFGIRGFYLLRRQARRLPVAWHCFNTLALRERNGNAASLPHRHFMYVTPQD